MISLDLEKVFRNLVLTCKTRDGILRELFQEEVYEEFISILAQESVSEFNKIGLNSREENISSHKLLILFWDMAQEEFSDSYKDEYADDAKGFFTKLASAKSKDFLDAINFHKQLRYMPAEEFYGRVTFMDYLTPSLDLIGRLVSEHTTLPIQAIKPY